MIVLYISEKRSNQVVRIFHERRENSLGYGGVRSQRLYNRVVCIINAQTGSSSFHAFAFRRQVNSTSITYYYTIALEANCRGHKNSCPFSKIIL